MLRQKRFLAEQGEETEVVFHTVDGVVLWDAAADQEPIEPPVVFVFVAQAQAGSDETGNQTVVNSAEGVDVDGNVVSLSPEFAEERERLQSAFADQVPLVNDVEVRIAFEQVFR